MIVIAVVQIRIIEDLPPLFSIVQKVLASVKGKKKKKKVIKIENNKVKLDSRHRKQTYGYQRG